MQEIKIDAMEIIEDLKKQIADLIYTNSILNIKCEKLRNMVEEIKNNQ